MISFSHLTYLVPLHCLGKQLKPKYDEFSLKLLISLSYYSMILNVKPLFYLLIIQLTV